MLGERCVSTHEADCQCGEPATVVIVCFAGWVLEACLDCARHYADPVWNELRPYKVRELSDKEEHTFFVAEMMGQHESTAP